MLIKIYQTFLVLIHLSNSIPVSFCSSFYQFDENTFVPHNISGIGAISLFTKSFFCLILAYVVISIIFQSHRGSFQTALRDLSDNLWINQKGGSWPSLHSNHIINVLQFLRLRKLFVLALERTE